MKPLALELSRAARQLIDDTMRNQEPGSLPVLLFADSRSTFDSRSNLLKDEGPHWYIGVYTQAQVSQLAPGYEEQGQPLVYSVGELALCIPQAQLVAGLAGSTLEARDGHVWVETLSRSA